MIIAQGAQAMYPQPLASLPSPPETEPAVTDVARPIAKGGARGLSLLSGDAVAVVIAEQASVTQDAKPAGLDLRGRDLRQIDLSKLDLRGADLSGTDMSGMDLTGLDLGGATLDSAKLDGANLTDTRLTGVNAKGASFVQATLVRTDMNNGDFPEARFSNAYISGLEKGAGPANEETRLQGKIFVVASAGFNNADFLGATIRGQFTKSVLDGADFTQVDAHFNINDSSVKGASFKGVSGR